MSASTVLLRAVLLTLVVLSARATCAQQAPSFRYDVLPTLTRAGCNSGTCHGTPSGKNGFRLSLRGYDPTSDFVGLTRDAGGRRIDRLRPAKSLMLRKATMQVAHQGGRRFGTGDAAYQRLREWIATGALNDSVDHRTLTRLTIEPSAPVIDAPHDSQSFRVRADFDDGSVADVTDRCRFSITDRKVAALEPSGTVRKRSRGEVAVSAEYAGAMASTTLLFREPVPEFAWTEPPANNRIDELVFARLKWLQIEPANLADDATFLRRVCLDLNGRLPTPDEVRTFLADTSPDKRRRLIDELLQRPEFATWWALKWSDRLGCNQRFVGKAGAVKYHAWIRHAMASNMPHDEFVRTILTASGPNYSNPPAGFWRRLRVGGIGRMDPLLAAEEVSQLFLGVRIQCARCHNHPGEKWTQSDYYGLAAFFPQVDFKDGPFVKQQYDKEVTVFPVAAGEVTHPQTSATAVPTVLGGDAVPIKPGTDRRGALAEWITSPENPFFARAAVNRIWFHLFGRGIVEPVDDLRSSNPPSHPELLEWLTEEFVASGFDRKHVIRLILNSRTYQFYFRPTATSRQDGRYFSYRPPQLLQAEQLLDAISHATAAAEPFPGFPRGTKAVALPDGEYKHPFLEAFGRPARAMACECEREASTSMSQALHITAGAVVHDKLTSDDGRCAELAASPLSDAEILDELFLTTLSRFPTSEEREVLVGHFESRPVQKRMSIENVLWTLLNHREFLFQH